MPLTLKQQPVTESGRRTLRAGFAAVALKLQEGADGGVGHQAIVGRLSDGLRDSLKTSGQWGAYLDHFGDEESGDVIYSVGGQTKKAPYSMSSPSGKLATSIDTENAVDVTPRTVYEEEADDSDHYTAMEAAKLYQYGLPLYERFIGKAERKDAPSGSFAGKGKSFPILKPSDVMAAVHAMGRAGSENFSSDAIKANIIRIAKAKGWTKQLPTAWQGDGAKESAVRQSGTLQLVESATTLEIINLREAARADYPIKLISPGKGATAFYPSEVLKRDGPKAFPAHTKVYLNHPKESEKDEAVGNRDVTRLAGVLTQPAEWQESGANGPGLYSRIKVFADHAQMLEDKAHHLHMSINAGGDQAIEAGGKKLLFKDGQPVLGRLHEADPAKNMNSVDIVPVGGAGGMILTEAAKPANSNQEDSDMEAAELTKLQESVATQTAINSRLLERAIRADARVEAGRILKGTTLMEAAKQRVIESVLSDIARKDGEIDTVKFTEAVNAAAKTEGAYVAQLTGSGRVYGMGTPVPVAIDTNEATRQTADRKRLHESAVRSYVALGLPKEAAEKAAGEEAA
jgi:hypothetical protein